MTYVISDIHGMYDKYAEILRQIDFKESDILYVIGDVVDRGEAPMKVLLDMMSRPNVYPLMGNHDLIALELLTKIDKILEKSGGLDGKLSQVLQVWISDTGKTTLSDFCKLLIDKETRGREIRRKKPKEPVNDREKWRNKAVCKCKEMQVNRKSAGSGCQSLSALFCC